MEQKMELKDMKNPDHDQQDHHGFHIPDEVKRQVWGCWKIVMFVLSWTSAVLYAWDTILNVFVYKHWKKHLPPDEFRNLTISWIFFSVLALLYIGLVVYNNTAESIHFLCPKRKSCIEPFSHQYSIFFAFYFIELPKSIIYIIFLTQLGKLEPSKLTGFNQGMMNGGMYDHLIFKVVTNIAKSSIFFIMCIVDCCDIVKKDKAKLMLGLNILGVFIHIAIQIGTIWLKVYIHTE